MKLKFSEKIFPKPFNIGKRNWGTEILLGLISKKISLKKLKIKKGKGDYNITIKKMNVVISYLES